MIAQVDQEYFRRRPFSAFRRIVSRIFFEGRPITSRGRWFNGVVFFLFRILQRLPQLRKIVKPVFIVGTGRSGTTILGTLFSFHPEVGYLNEPKALWHVIYSKEDVSGNYSSGAASFRLSAKDASPDVVKIAHRLFGNYLNAVMAKRVIDKDPEIIFRIPFVKSIFPDAKFIFLVRNGWDTIKSIAAYSDREGIQVKDGIQDWWGVNNRKWHIMLDELVAKDEDLGQFIQTIRGFSRQVDMAAVEWIVTMKEGIKQQRRDPGVIMMQRYEDLAADPKAELIKLLNFCELGADEKLSAYAEKRLHPAPHGGVIDIDPCLREPFNDMLGQLGY